MTKHLVAVLTVFLAAAAAPAMAAAPALPPAAPAADNPESAQARATLLTMADQLAKAQSFTVTVQAGYDVVQDSGQKIEFGETRKVFLSRPDHLRIDVEHSDGEQQQTYFDGKEIVIFDPREKVMARLSKPGTVDEGLYHLVGALKTRVPLSVLLATTFRKEMESRVTEIDLVEHTSIAGQQVDHLAARTPDVDFQVWITSGAKPVPLRVVITYKNVPGQPQFWANLSDWNFDPKIDPATFLFVPPAGTEAIPFMVPVAEQAGPRAPGAK